ncbi:MAG: tRNA epoxyqueuosine(34) reductase QueG [Gammaproteobacteria bacterium]|nr:tRNA epoxyqueuosine(34) reductase QueG [Gammaproteobacteria bacterium]MCP5200704.1 tRNA epoxyqueuosine(34) reductase QueG [Gammaproteobacteria bacterium]
MSDAPRPAALDGPAIVAALEDWGRDLGFGAVAVARCDLDTDDAHLQAWLARGFHGSMGYLARNGDKRREPAALVPGTLSVISARMDYLPEPLAAAMARLDEPATAYVARYALGRDYHKTLRGRLRRLAARLAERIGPYGYRAFCDSAPVLERALARNAGLGWIGKHTCLIDRHAGSLFFLGEIYTDLDLPASAVEATEHCGSCTRCLDVCPTAAIVAPYRLDARRCISYLTIESRDPIPLALRPLIGNRVFGCDDCQLVCPWNRYARPSAEADFAPRHGLDGRRLVELFALDAAAFERLTEGSALRRVSHDQWLRNLAVALGNAPREPAVIAALVARREHPSPLVREHVAWALARHGATP